MSLVADAFLMTSEFLSRIFKLVGIYLHTDVFMFLNAPFQFLQILILDKHLYFIFFLEIEEFTVNIFSTKGLKNNIVL